MRVVDIDTSADFIVRRRLLLAGAILKAGEHLPADSPLREQPRKLRDLFRRHYLRLRVLHLYRLPRDARGYRGGFHLLISYRAPRGLAPEIFPNLAHLHAFGNSYCHPAFLLFRRPPGNFFRTHDAGFYFLRRARRSRPVPEYRKNRRDVQLCGGFQLAAQSRRPPGDFLAGGNMLARWNILGA